MQSSFSLSKVTVIVFCTLLAIEPALRTAAAIYRSEGPVFRALLSGGINSDQLRALEDTLEKGSPLVNTLRPPLQAARFLALREGGEKLLLGQEDWWFYRPAVEYLNAPLRPAQLEEAVNAVLHFQRQLEARGISLVFVPMPDKATVCSRFLTGHELPQTRSHGQAFIAALRARGIETVDLFTPFGANAQLFLKHDTHWTPAGVDLAVEAIAKALREKGLAPAPSASFALEQVEAARTGDLLRMLDVQRLQERYAQERVACTRVLNAQGAPFQPSSSAPVLVLGDSFLRIYEKDAPGSAGFVAHLAAVLEAPVSAIISDGGAANRVREELARRPSLLERARVVVWEVAERDLGLAEGGWRRIALR